MLLLESIRIGVPTMYVTGPIVRAKIVQNKHRKTEEQRNTTGKPRATETEVKTE